MRKHWILKPLTASDPLSNSNSTALSGRVRRDTGAVEASLPTFETHGEEDSDIAARAKVARKHEFSKLEIQNNV